MKNNYIVKIKKPYVEAWSKYGWDVGVEGLVIPQHLLLIAAQAEKSIVFKVRRTHYQIHPTDALHVAKQHHSYYKAKTGQLIAVIPKNACQKVQL